MVRPGGRTIRAGTSAGWWAAWWPDHQAGEADAVRIVVRTATGSRTYRTRDPLHRRAASRASRARRARR